MTHVADQCIADAREHVQGMTTEYPELATLCRTPEEALVRFGQTLLEVYEAPANLALMLAVAIADRAGVGQLPAVDDIEAPAVLGHAVAVVKAVGGGLWLWVCDCTAMAYADSEDEAVSALDAHIANPEPVALVDAGMDLPQLDHAAICAWLNASPRCFAEIMRAPWCSSVMETGGVTDEVELVDCSRLVVVDGRWVPKAGA